MKTKPLWGVGGRKRKRIPALGDTFDALRTPRTCPRVPRYVCSPLTGAGRGCSPFANGSPGLQRHVSIDQTEPSQHLARFSIGRAVSGSERYGLAKSNNGQRSFHSRPTSRLSYTFHQMPMFAATTRSAILSPSSWTISLPSFASFPELPPPAFSWARLRSRRSVAWTRSRTGPT